MNLLESSIRIIKANQHASGAYIACPNFQVYRYCWLRDGCFTAYAMDRSGETASAERFYQWVNQVIGSRAGQVRALIAKKQAGQPIARSEYLATRYTLEGETDESEWGNFQMDGYGAWLWGLAEHLRLTGQSQLPDRYRRAVQLSIEYLTTFWQTPNYDCWEENPEEVHPSTLACIAGGIKAVSRYLEQPELTTVAGAIERYIRSRFVCQAAHPPYLVKFQGSAAVDANLLWVAVPFGVIAAEEAVIQATIAQIERELYKNQAGVHRYLTDSYYGGGAWILLTAWLGWYYALVGRRAEAWRIKEWIERQADAAGELAEQIGINLNRPEYLPLWLEKWGPVAKPLLWSHAMYLILCQELS